MCLVKYVSSENQALSKAFEIESHPFKVKSTPVTTKVVLEINSHPFKVTKNVIGKQVTCRLDLGGVLGGQLPKGCRERKCARLFVSFASRSPDVGIMCQLLVILISGSIVMSPGIVCGLLSHRYSAPLRPTSWVVGPSTRGHSRTSV